MHEVKHINIMIEVIITFIIYIGVFLLRLSTHFLFNALNIL